jgi:2-iminobutanoate/2-iminopropanoate deaminase
MRRRTVALGLLGVGAAALAGARSRGREGTGSRVERYPHAPLGGRHLPFSEAVRVGDLLLLSGQIGNRPGGLELVAGGIGPETRQTMENIAAILARRGAGLADVVKCTVMLADMSEWPAMNEVYTTFFAADALPARSALGASGLALGARVEIEAIAVLPR